MLTRLIQSLECLIRKSENGEKENTGIDIVCLRLHRFRSSQCFDDQHSRQSRESQRDTIRLFRTDEYVVCFMMHLQADWFWAGLLISFSFFARERLVWLACWS